MRAAIGERAAGLLAALVALAAWEGVCRGGLVSPVLLAPPTRVAAAAYRLVLSPAVQQDIAYTAGVYALSLGVALVGGTPIGLLMGSSDRVYRLVNPFVVALNCLPKIVLMPLITLWMGIGLQASVLLGALMAAFPIAIASCSGVRSLEQDLILLARSFHAGRWLTARAIVLPGITPFVVSGLRVGLSYAMVGVLTAEFFASSQGIGYRMVALVSNFQIDAFYGCLALVVALALSLTGLVAALERRLQSWRPAAPALRAGS